MRVEQGGASLEVTGVVAAIILRLLEHQDALAQLDKYQVSLDVAGQRVTGPFVRFCLARR